MIAASGHLASRFEGLTYLDLLLLQLQFLVELTGAIESGRTIHVLRTSQVAQINVAEAEVVAHQLLLGNTLWPELRERVEVTK